MIKGNVLELQFQCLDRKIENSMQLIMTTTRALLLLVMVITWTGIRAGRYGCPTRLQIRPCICVEKSRGLDVSCENAIVDQLREALASIARTKQPIWYLKLRNNKLGAMPSHLMNGLDVRHLIAHHSNLSSVDAHAFDSLAERIETLDFAQNNFERVPSHALRTLGLLVSLNLNYNKLDILHAEAFKGLTSLLRLSLYGNKIKFIDNLAFVGIGSNLTRINLGANRLTSVPSRPLKNLNQMQRLQLHENQISALMSDEFSTMGGEMLDVLEMANNDVRELPSRAFTSLKALNSLDLERNQIATIHPKAFEGIEDSLEWLKLGDNRLHDIPSVSLRNLSRLRQLDLRENNISRVREDDFLPYGKNLKFIYLQKNWLTTIDPSSLMSLDSLEWFYLHSNQLTSIPYETYEPVLNTLQVFDIHDNPLECDCRIAWFRDWIRDKGTSIVALSLETRCDSPEEYYHLSVKDVPDTQLPCNSARTAQVLFTLITTSTWTIWRLSSVLVS